MFAPENLGKGGKISGKRMFEKKIGIFDPANKEKCREGYREGGKIRAYILFEIDGLFQQATLSTILKM